jgi:uncharacterized protein
MKNSRFNLFFPFENYIVGYNSLENDFIFLTPELHELYRQTASDKIDNLKDIHPDFFDMLVQKSFCIPDDTDELKQVENMVRSIDSNPEIFQIIINPTMNCNFKCWYCYETHILDSKMEKPEIDKIMRLIDNTLNNPEIRYFSIGWFGGEPLLYFKQVVLPVLEHVRSFIDNHDKEIIFQSDFTSNGLLINDKLLSDCARLGVKSFQITLDGHRQKHNQVRFISERLGSYDQIITNIKRCLKYNIHVICRINLSKETINEDLIQIIGDFSDLSESERKQISFSFQQVWQEETDLNDEILKTIEYFKNNGLQTNYARFSDTVQFSCYADKRNQATINFNGDVFKCTARDFKTENREGILMDDGNIQWNEKYIERMNAKFKNPPCLKCSIMPVCNGSCSQKAIENKGKEYCVNSFDEKKKIDIIREKLIYAIS